MKQQKRAALLKLLFGLGKKEKKRLVVAVGNLRVHQKHVKQLDSKLHKIAYELTRYRLKHFIRASEKYMEAIPVDVDAKHLRITLRQQLLYDLKALADKRVVSQKLRVRKIMREGVAAAKEH